MTELEAMFHIPERVLVEDLDDGLGAVVEVEAEAAVDHEARVEAPRLHLDAPRRASGLTLAPALKDRTNVLQMQVMFVTMISQTREAL